MAKLTIEKIVGLLKQIAYKDWEFKVVKSGDGFLMHVVFYAPDNDAPGSEPTEQHGRKWYVSQHMTDSELIQSAFLAIKTAEEHEMRELFLYKGQRVFGPHFNLIGLAQLAADMGVASYDKRT